MPFFLDNNAIFIARIAICVGSIFHIVQLLPISDSSHSMESSFPPFLNPSISPRLVVLWIHFILGVMLRRNILLTSSQCGVGYVPGRCASSCGGGYGHGGECFGCASVRSRFCQSGRCTTIHHDKPGGRKNRSNEASTQDCQLTQA